MLWCSKDTLFFLTLYCCSISSPLCLNALPVSLKATISTSPDCGMRHTIWVEFILVFPVGWHEYLSVRLHAQLSQITCVHASLRSNHSRTNTVIWFSRESCKRRVWCVSSCVHFLQPAARVTSRRHNPVRHFSQCDFSVHVLCVFRHVWLYNDLILLKQCSLRGLRRTCQHPNKISALGTNMQHRVSLWPCLLGSSICAEASTGACAESMCWDSTQWGVEADLCRHWYKGHYITQALPEIFIFGQADFEYCYMRKETQNM